jgi:hypothetical protein
MCRIDLEVLAPRPGVGFHRSKSMSGNTSAEIVLAIAFLLGLLLPITLGTEVTPPGSVLDLINGFSKSNLSLYKLFVGPGFGILLVIALFADPKVNGLYGVAAFVLICLLEIGALKLGAKQTRRQMSGFNSDSISDGLDYANRFKRLEDQIANSSPPDRRNKRQ